jgi:chromosomal replication initiation ATPase DnaA
VNAFTQFEEGAIGTFFSTRIRGQRQIVRFLRHSGFSQSYHTERMPIAHVQQVVACYYGLTQDDMRSADRSAAISHPRQIAMYLARELTSHSLPELGRRFGGKDHTTVLHAVRTVTERINNCERIADEVSVLRETIERSAMLRDHAA